MIQIETLEGRSKYGSRMLFQTRLGTSDGDVVRVVAGGEEYPMPQGLEGWVIDVGAHIGAFTIPMALDNPGVSVIAVEAVPENCELLRNNVRINGLADRVWVVEGAAGKMGEPVLCHWGYKHDEGRDEDGFVAAHRFVGNTWQDQAEPEFGGMMEPVTLGGLLEQFGIDQVEFMKIDCEGCEWSFLDTAAVARVKVIVGEYHSGLSGSPIFHSSPVADIVALLSSTHLIGVGNDNAIGPFQAVIKP